MDVLKRDFGKYKVGNEIVRLEILEERVDTLGGNPGRFYKTRVVEVMSSERSPSEILGLEYDLFVADGSKTDSLKGGTFFDYWR